MNGICILPKKKKVLLLIFQKISYCMIVRQNITLIIDDQVLSDKSGSFIHCGNKEEEEWVKKRLKKRTVIEWVC